MLHRTVYRYGSTFTGHYGFMALRADGLVGHYRHENEHRYRLEDGALKFFNAKDEQTSQLVYFPDANCALDKGRNGHYLLSALQLAPPAQPGSLAPLLVNSIPKSGTYYLEAAINRLGATRLRVHLGQNDCHDYRGLPDDAMHVRPSDQYLPIPAAAIAQIIQPNELAVGHIDDHDSLDACAAAGVQLLHCVRNLRDVLVSLYHFKRDRVAPTSLADSVWRSLSGAAGFTAFLAFYAERDIAHITSCATVILARPEPVLRYEDARAGTPHEAVSALFGAGGLASALEAVRDQPTPTFSGGRPPSAHLWSPAAEAFFQESGLEALNERLGYGAPIENYSDAAD